MNNINITDIKLFNTSVINTNIAAEVPSVRNTFVVPAFSLPYFLISIL